MTTHVLGLQAKDFHRSDRFKLVGVNVRHSKPTYMAPEEIACLRKKYGADPFFGTDFSVSPVMLALFEMLKNAPDDGVEYNWFERRSVAELPFDRNLHGRMKL